MPASKRYPVVAIVMVGALWGSLPPTAWSQELDAAAILNSIDRGVNYLKRSQRNKGNWSDMLSAPGGLSALVTLALLNAGESPDDPVIAKALKYVREFQTPENRTYFVSLRIMTLCAAEPKRDRETIRKAVQWLGEAQVKQGATAGGWGYSDGRLGESDPSNSQFAVLALHEAERAGIGIKVDSEVWRLAADYWRRTQREDGSWGYGAGLPSTGSMACAGIGALIITSQAEGGGDARVVGGQVRCCQSPQGEETDEARIQRAVKWLGNAFSVRRNPGVAAQPRSWHLYYLYGLERVGRLGARRLIGQHDWYREGAEFLIGSQDPLRGYWTGGSATEKNKELATAMALLFLSKGKRPVLLAKLDYGEGWNSHRNDATNLTREVEQAWGLDLTWQRFDPRTATIDDLLQAPVLYLSGRQAADLTPFAKKLRGYVDRGGFIFAEACCGDSPPFRRDFQRLVEAMFPESQYALRQLDPPPNHPMWRTERLVRPESSYVGKLYGVEYGCRTCIVYSDEDLSCYWELNRVGAVESYPRAVRRQIDDANTIGLNVLAYATNREPKGKEEKIAQRPQGDQFDGERRRGRIGVAKLRHGGGCNDAPGALVNLTRTASEGEARLEVATDAPLIDIGDPSLPEFLVCFMHGRHDFQLTLSERKKLAEYLTNGGTLLADSICASDTFTTAFRREITTALPNARLQRVPANDPLFTDAFGGFDVRQVTLRDPQPASDNEPLAARTRSIAPEIEGIQIDGRWAVLFSRHDLSCALERHEAIQCRGYSREDAARIGVNVFLYSINH